MFWPKDLLPEVIAETRIYTWGYDVEINHVFSAASQATVFQDAAYLLSDLDDERISEDDVQSRFITSHLDSGPGCLRALSYAGRLQVQVI